jgi:hypothetical protein
MADKEHLAIIKQGVRAWNMWGEENPRMVSDLSNADLRDADLNRYLHSLIYFLLFVLLVVI